MTVPPTFAGDGGVVADAGLDARVAEANAPSSKVLRLPASEPLRLACDQLLAPISIAYETYGALNAEKSNAILVCHALTGDQYVASEHPVTKKPGWWETLVGPGKPIDTDRFFVICPNILGGCMGSTGPASIDPKTGKPYGLHFPVITVCDMVNAQVRLIDHLGIEQLFCVIGGSMGGMQVLEWASSHTEPRVLGRAHRHGRMAFLAEHRLPRGRAPGRDGRSRLVRRRLPCARQGAAQRARGRAHGRAHHLPVGGRAAPQVRPLPAGPLQAHLLLQRRLPGGELPAPSGLDLRRPLRRQQLSLHHAGDGLLRSRRRARRRARQRLPRHQDALLRRLLHLGLALPDARDAARSCRP